MRALGTTPPHLDVCLRLGRSGDLLTLCIFVQDNTLALRVAIVIWALGADFDVFLLAVLFVYGSVL